MGPKGQQIKKMKIPTDTPAEFEFGDTVTDIQWRKEDRRTEREGGWGEGGSQEGGNSTVTDAGGIVAKKDQELRGVTVKWTHVRPAKPLSANPGTRKNNNEHLFNILR